jgi:hypothetical protein
VFHTAANTAHQEQHPLWLPFLSLGNRTRSDHADYDVLFVAPINNDQNAVRRQPRGSCLCASDKFYFLMLPSALNSEI